MRRFVSTAIAALAVSACAPTYSWQHATFSGPAAERQRHIDSAECEVYAMQVVPLRAPAAQPQLGEYQVDLRSDRLGGENYSGTVTEKSASGGTLSPFEQGMADARREAEYDRARTAQDDLAEASMLRRGWTMVSE